MSIYSREKLVSRLTYDVEFLRDWLNGWDVTDDVYDLAEQWGMTTKEVYAAMREAAKAAGETSHRNPEPLVR